ncbi:hypothetical protein K439DRAFT_1369848 [Ramaria rubella]|nr:hypothetical protein K439DRAFT_1369848 [Ramaria rubella]
MTPIPAPSLVLPREEWADTDFDLPEGDALNTQSDAESDNDAEDWDIEMDLGTTGGAKAVPASSPLASSPTRSFSNMITIRPPIQLNPGEQADDEDDYDDEGASTIKVAHMPPIPPKTPPPPDDDIETAFELPSELSRLSLRPLPLHHRASKTSLEWGDRDHTSSSTSSDAYSSLGFGPSASPSSNSTSAPSVGELDTDEEEDDEDGELEGLILPTSLFDSHHGSRQLSKILEAKKRLPVVDERAKVTSPDSEDDFEIGLVIDDDFDLSPSRLPSNRLQPVPEKKKTISRSKSAPPRPPIGAFRPSSRLAGSKDRSKSPTMPTSSSAKGMRPLALSPPPVSRPTLSRKLTVPSLSSAPPSSHSSSFVQSPTTGPLRAQKSHSVLKPPSPRGPTTGGRLARKASLSSLIDTAVSAGPSSASIQSPTSYNAPTAASRARAQHSQTHFNPSSTTRLRAPDLERYYHVPPTRPSTPSSSTAALRLTMPTSSSRAKVRPAIASVFGPVSSVKDGRASSPLPTRPPSTASSGSSSRNHSTPQVQAHASGATKVLRRPKRARTYGDGTELDGIEDLPTDREREGRYRVTPRGTGAPRLSKGSTEKEAKETKGTIGRKSCKREAPESKLPAPVTNTLRRKERIDFASKVTEVQPTKTSRKKTAPQSPSTLPSGTTRRKPTLIRNLGGAGPPKVVGDMKWNPQSLRWEGNEQALRDFDAATSSSTRPALITHLTGSSIGSPVTTFASGARVVGNMIFDPARMCWISRLPPEEDEPDVFADLADDEEEDWDRKGGTIRANQLMDQSLVTAATRGDTPSPGRPTSTHSRTMSESESERGARPALTSLLDLDGKLLDKCRVAEDRHRAEMKGWRLHPPGENDDEPDRSSLHEIRALATRQY